MAFKTIAIMGECMVELAGQPFGDMKQGFGGDTMNTALYLKRLVSTRCDVAYVTAMGNDALSQGIVSRWQEEGIDTNFVLTDQSRQPGLYMIQNDPNGERSFSYWRDNAAARFIMQSSRIADVMAELSSWDCFYLSGISLAILPSGDRLTLLSAIKKLKLAGVKIVFDSNYRPSLWESLEHTQACYAAMYELCDLALLTLEDEQQVWQDACLEKCLARLNPYDLPILAIKLGAQGCYVQTPGLGQLIATERVSNVVDTTAAGDSFNAGFLAAWLNGRDAVTCADIGNTLAGRVIQHKGAIVPVSMGDLNVQSN